MDVSDLTKETPEFLPGPCERARQITLKWPFNLDNVEHRQVTISRINGHQAKAYYGAVVASIQTGVAVPVFPGLSISQEVWEMLDDDDVLALEQAVEDFLPARFQPLIALLNNMLGPEDGSSSATGGSSPA